MWRSSYSRSLLRTLLGGSQRRIECRSAKHPILLWSPLSFRSSSCLYLAAGGVGGGSAAESITFVDAPKQKLERDGEEVIGYPQLLEGTGLGRFRDEAVACRMLHGAGAVLLFRTTVCSRPSKFVAGYCCENYATSSSSYSSYDRTMNRQLLDFKDSKEAVYGTLDAWVAWEHSFPLVTLKKALLVLEKEEQWHRVVQVIKWMLSKGQGTTMGTYEQLIRALEKDNRAEEAHRIWVKKISHDLHSVPWRFCDLMLSIYYRNNMLERLVMLFQELEAYDRKPPSKSVVRKVGDAYEVLGLLEKKNKLLEKYNNLFSEISDKTSRSSKRSKRVAGINDERAELIHLQKIQIVGLRMQKLMQEFKLVV
ncbi:Pentatricopeptide repeat-containing protein [Musa troglodytarum]|uniref:Pentatricopeptide repeat-containing protein n=1 Tax=Musa troglodytarum TaxID=320322 RepID=A0A9E7FR81_9LILI|nr:Pentatricopeptide repeat-containing protein [Musa troglodytarum]